MSADEEQIIDILIDRDIRAFVDGDWQHTAQDFDADAFAGYSGADGTVRLTFPTLDAYRDSWIGQSAELRSGIDPARLAAQLGHAQRITRIEAAEGRALAVKEFDGAIQLPDGERLLQWTTYYFLRFDTAAGRWRITGFLGYLPGGRSRG